MNGVYVISWSSTDLSHHHDEHRVIASSKAIYEWTVHACPSNFEQWRTLT
jgi:hypothetical protein